MKTSWSLGIVLALTCVACKKANAPAGTAADHAGSSAWSRGDQSLTLPPAIPASAVMVGALDAPPDWTSGAVDMGLFDDGVTRAALADLDTYLTKTTGVSLAKIHRAAFFVTADGKPAVLVSQVSGQWKVATPPDVKVAMQGDWMVIGEASAVDLAVATATGKSPRLASDSVLATLFAKESRGALVAAAVDVAQLPPQPRMMAAAYGVERGAISAGGVLRVVVEGNAEGLGKLVQLYDQQTTGVLQQLDTQRTSALATASVETGPREQDVAAIVGSHFVRAAAQLVRPKLDGNSLRVEVALPANAAMVVPVIGVLSAVAIPAFLKYKRRSEALRDMQEMPEDAME